MLSIVKVALRIRGDEFDEQINDLIAAAMQDLKISGVIVPDEIDPITRTAIITYVRMNFGEPDNYEQLKASYDEQKAQLSTATGYTNWLEG